MDPEKWERLKEDLKVRFKILSEGTEDLKAMTGEGEVKSGTAEVLILQTPMGKVKLSYESKPLLLDKKFIYSHRGGQSARTEYKFSESEFTQKLKAYLWSEDDDSWKEIDASKFA